MIYLNIEVISPGLYRVSSYLDMSGLLRLLNMLRGREISVNKTVVEHGHPRTVSDHIDRVLE